MVRWTLEAHPISVRARWEALRDGLHGAGLPVEELRRSNSRRLNSRSLTRRRGRLSELRLILGLSRQIFYLPDAMLYRHAKRASNCVISPICWVDQRSSANIRQTRSPPTPCWSADFPIRQLNIFWRAWPARPEIHRERDRDERADASAA